MPAKKAKPTPGAFGVSTVEVETVIKAAPVRVWRALAVQTPAWWPRTHFVGAARGMHIEPKLGGRMYEDWGRGAGVTWATVIAVDPPRSLILEGVLLARFGGPATSILEFELMPAGKATRLRVTDTAFGRLDAGPRDSTREGWTAILDALRKHVGR